VEVSVLARKAVPDSFKVFPERLSSLMKEKNLRQQDLADFLGVKRQTVSLYMTGQSIPDAEQLKNIAVFFKVSADWLIGLSSVKSTAPDVKNICKYTGLSENAVEWLHGLSTLEPDLQWIFILNELMGTEAFESVLSYINMARKSIPSLENLRLEFSSIDNAREIASALNEVYKVIDSVGLNGCQVISGHEAAQNMKITLQKMFLDMFEEIFMVDCKMKLDT